MSAPSLTDLRARRVEKNLSQADLSDRLDVSIRTVRAIENGAYAPSVTLACRIARVLERPVEDLFQP